jgi:protoporphyrinogen oxidase
VNFLPKVPAKIKRYAKKLRFNSLIEVLIGFKDAGAEDKHWLYIPQPDIKTHRVIFISKYSPTMAPEGKKGIMAEITCAPGGEFWKKTDREIIALITSQLDSLGLAQKSDVIFSKVERFKYAYVVNDFNYEFCSQQVKKYLECLGIVICGRFSEWKYLNMDATIQSAMDTAKKIR